MKKKQLVAVFVMMLAAATMATACQTPEAKAKDALKYLDEKYSDEQVIELEWSAGAGYDTLTYNFLENFKVSNGFEMEVYADEALTQLEEQEALQLAEGNNDFWIVVFKAGKNKDDKSAHVFKVNINKPVTVDVTLDVEGVETVLSPVAEGTFIEAPAAPVLPVQKQFEGWFRDPTYLVPYTPGEQTEDFTLYAKIGEGTWTTDVNIMCENIADDGYTADGTVAAQFVGTADKAEFVHNITGFVYDRLEANGSEVTAYYKRETYTVTLLEVDGVTPSTTVENVKYGAVPDLSAYSVTKPDDGETVYKFASWVTLDDQEVGAVTGAVSYKPTFTSSQREYTVTADIEGASIELVGEKNTFLKDETVSFKLNIDADYNRSEYTVYVGSEALTAVDGVYSYVVPGGGAGCDVVITAEGIEQNVYNISASVLVVNKDADFALIESETDVVIKVNGEEFAYTDLNNLVIPAKSGDTVIEVIANDIVYHTETVTIEAGQEDVELDDVYIGYYNLKGLDATADGLINSGTSQIQAFFEDLPSDAEKFYISYTVKNEWDRMPEDLEREPSPGYGWAFDNGDGTWMNVMLLDKNIMISYNGMKNGWDPIFTGHAFTAESINAATDSMDGLKLSVMKRGGALYFYIDGNLEFVLTEDGFVSVTTDIQLDSAKNAIIAERVSAFLNSDSLKVGQYVTMGGGKYVPYVVKNASFTTDADKLAKYNEYGSVTVSVDKTGAELRQVLASVYVGEVSALTDVNIMKTATIDLNDYFMIGKSVGIKFGNFFHQTGAKDLDSIIVYTTKDGVEDSGVNITDKVLYVDNEYYQYNFMPEKGASYRFEIKAKEAVGRYAANFAIKTVDDGNFANGVSFDVYKADGTLVYTSITSTV